ncbi:hypothetical protein HYU16_00110 [Candidatus Woesearchaeota archaeon]|nr:hypothetical protein [Candidatus Woesearchaeota archaeon]
MMFGQHDVYLSKLMSYGQQSSQPSAPVSAPAAAAMPNAPYYELAHKPAPIAATTREVPASELLEKPQAIQTGQMEEPADAEESEAGEAEATGTTNAESRAADEDEGFHDTRDIENLDTEIEGIRKKIEELKGLSKATVKLPG